MSNNFELVKPYSGTAYVVASRHSLLLRRCYTIIRFSPLFNYLYMFINVHVFVSIVYMLCSPMLEAIKNLPLTKCIFRNVLASLSCMFCLTGYFYIHNFAMGILVCSLWSLCWVLFTGWTCIFLTIHVHDRKKLELIVSCCRYSLTMRSKAMPNHIHSAHCSM